MRHLAVRFVRQINLARIESNECPIFGLNNNIHVVDPQLDFHDRFRGEKAIKLCRSILARKISIDLLRIRREYDNWYNAFKELETEQNKPASIEKRHIRGKCLDNVTGLFSVLKLPNDLEQENPCTSSENGISDAGNSGRSLNNAFVAQINRSGRRQNLVQLRRLFLSQLQRLIFSTVHPTPQIVSFPHLVRPAVVEVCNLQLDSFPLVVENNSYLSLTGVDLPSLISPLIKCRFSHNYNIWPLVLVTSGNVHSVTSFNRTNNSGPFDQNAQLSLLILDEELHKCFEVVQQLRLLFHAFITDIGLSFDIADVKPPNLFFYERSANTFFHSLSNMELARFSSIGDYVSRRARVTKAVPTNAKTHNIYLNMAFVRVNLDAIVKSYYGRFQ